VSLRLVTGPANAAKAAHVLGAFRDRLADEPFLVVPAFRDVEHAQREAAERGAVLGARVVRFTWLFDEIASRCADDPSRGRRASDLQRELIVAQAVRRANLTALAQSAERPGFTRAATRFIGELERALITPQRFARALSDWAQEGPRAQFAAELAAIYRGYRDGMDAAGLASEELAAWRAADALREHPDRWGRTPVFVYGFDDFTELELDAIETLAGKADAEVTVSLPYERGRAAFKALSTVFQRLIDLAGGNHVEVEATDEFYAPESRGPLHYLERHLFEPLGDADKADPGGALKLLAAGGERAEVELIAAEVLDLLRSGIEPGQVAVVYRDPAAYGSVVEQVFDAYGIPFSIDRRVPLAHTTLGRALLALLRCATGRGTADDLLAWLRAPGYLRRPEMADSLEAELRKRGARDLGAARQLWEDTHDWQLDEIDRVAAAAERGAEQLLAELDKRLEALFTRPYRRDAHVFTGAERDDPRVWNEAHGAIGHLNSLVASGGARGLGARAIHDALAELPVRMGDDPRPERVQVASPEQVRARRFQAVIVAGMQEGELPRGAAPDPFLSDDDRRALAIATGVRLPVRDDQLERERYLFYVCASRAERVLMLSSRVSDEEGNPQVGSFFLQDVADLFEGLGDTRRLRALGDVAWPLLQAPTQQEWRRAAAAAGPRVPQRPPGGLAEPAVLEALAERELSTSALEAYSDCPVKWLVDRILKPDQLEPDPEYMVRGNYAHAVLELTYARLRDRTGDRRVTRQNLTEAEDILREAMHETEDQFQLSPQQTRVRAAVRKLQFDLMRYLRREAESEGRFEPEKLELQFGGGGELDRLPALDIDGVTIQGKIDRVDTLDGKAVVRDYKSGRKTWPVARWEEDRRLQVALYMIAVRDLMDLEPVGGFYVPLAPGSKPRDAVPRGVVQKGWEEDVDPEAFPNDVKEREEIDELLAAAREQVVALAGEMKSGAIRPCPDTCSFRGGCTYPSICRSEKPKK
jgi:ATP-dependent helicase/DNAse subunit B